MKVNSNMKVVVAATLLGLASQTQAAGFAIIEQSGSGMGNAYAGAAAVAEDAGTIFFNPAGMTYIEGTQIVGAIHIIKPKADFDNQGSVNAAPRPLGDEGGDAVSYTHLPLPTLPGLMRYLASDSAQSGYAASNLWPL